MERIPQVTLELIEYLERICPDKSPDLSTPDRNIWFNSGRVDLVRHLRSIHDEQHQTTMIGD